MFPYWNIRVPAWEHLRSSTGTYKFRHRNTNVPLEEQQVKYIQRREHTDENVAILTNDKE
ncbi:hypothetical protein HMPREF9969_0583 [Prevotella sp. oral taxon 306 str. F0472]|nr:hypothetical protein HMPREF9969_0583 [Prevotella sp. oral taxon 306 str. F0472]